MMLANGATDVIVAVLVGLSTIGGALIGLRGVVYSVQAQKRPRIVELDPEEAHHELARERERRVAAEAELAVWREIVLETRRRLGDE
jgi:hypothetical protein